MYLTNVPPYRVTSLSDGSSPPVPLSGKSSPPCPPLREVLTPLSPSPRSPHPLSPSPFGRGGTLSVPLPRGVGTTPRQSPRRREKALSPTRPRREAGHPAGRGSGPARTQRIAGTAVAAR